MTGNNSSYFCYGIVVLNRDVLLMRAGRVEESFGLLYLQSCPSLVNELVVLCVHQWLSSGDRMTF